MPKMGGLQNNYELPDRTASFEIWSDTIRKAVCLAGEKGLMDVVDPVNSIDSSFATDPETQKLANLLTACQTSYGTRTFCIAELIKHAQINSEKDPELLEVLEEIAGQAGRINPRMLGRWIEKHAGRIRDNLRFVRSEKTKARRTWWYVSST